ncbi:MAG TPA: dethiobiotin synthase [Actinospica sp.]|nr:dethiobiotin synthase [Actinospica sp.]
MSILIVTGTGTDVGKTVATAAVAALAAARGGGVAVVKPAQTGVAPGEPGDLAEVARLAGISDTHEYARYPDPLSPAAAARISGLPALDLKRAAADIRKLAQDRALVIVEGAGGLLVRFDEDGATLADLARELGAPALVVVDPKLGTLNHTALTLESMALRGVELAGVVLGRWPYRKGASGDGSAVAAGVGVKAGTGAAPDAGAASVTANASSDAADADSAAAEPDLAMRCNLRELETLAARPLAGALPDGAGGLDPAEFLLAARSALAPSLGGTFDAARFRARWGR